MLQERDRSTYLDNARNYGEGERLRVTHSPECPSMELLTADICSCCAVLNRKGHKSLFPQDERENPHLHPDSYFYSPLP